MVKFKVGDRVEIVDEVMARRTGAEIRLGERGKVISVWTNYLCVLMDGDEDGTPWSIPMDGLKLIQKEGTKMPAKLTEPRPDWDTYFIRIASEVAMRSTCPRASVGAVIVKDNRILSTGYNGAPAGKPHCIDEGCIIDEGDDHCQRTIHAETNAIAQAAKYGVSIDGATLYYWDSKGRYASTVAELRDHCQKCGQLAEAAGMVRVCGRGL